MVSHWISILQFAWIVWPASPRDPLKQPPQFWDFRSASMLSSLNWCWGDKPQVMVAEQAPCRLNCVPKHRHYKLNNWSLLLSGVTGNEDTALGKQENKYGLYFCPFWDLWGVIVVWMCVCVWGVSLSFSSVVMHAFWVQCWVPWFLGVEAAAEGAEEHLDPQF